MNKYYIPIFFFFLLIVFGCASVPEYLSFEKCNATKFATAMEHEQCLNAAAKYEQEKYDRENRRIIRRDKLIVFLNACDRAESRVIMEKRFGRVRSMLPTDREKRAAMKQFGYHYTHDNVHPKADLNNFYCVNPQQLFKRMRRNGSL